MQETHDCTMTATTGGERQNALKAHVHPASMPAGGSPTLSGKNLIANCH